jgi:hypothetical protein
MLIAVTRAVSPTLAECELTHRPRDPINVAKAEGGVTCCNVLFDDAPQAS